MDAAKSERISSRCGYRHWWLNTRIGIMYLMAPKVRQGGCISFFVNEHKRGADSGRVESLYARRIHSQNVETGQESWCSEHLPLIRNIWAHVPHKEKNTFVQQLKAIWLVPTREQACKRLVCLQSLSQRTICSGDTAIN
ncbi:hypothetical protein [Agathobaculum sp. Marseille-P7918]|uniref:hypothetical protein n=1 Tax=Agathobaculum sp. Marseille-P7918 TaxID=2479843 RepID=UPI003564729F